VAVFFTLYAMSWFQSTGRLAQQFNLCFVPAKAARPFE
jgi:hypothetical protein